jgi:2-methylcitrate dehydratase PrpD
MTPLERLARFAAALRFEDLPPEVVSSLHERLLDTLGLCLAALRLETSRQAFDVACQWGSGDATRVIGFGSRLPAAGAAFVGGVLGHSLDFDDTHLPSVLHPSASLLPALLAVGEAVGADTHQLATAATIGYEVIIRTGMAGYDRALGNSVFFERGWHATSICGALGTAMAAGKLYGLDQAGLGHALGIAVSLGSGVIEGNRSGGSVKRLHCGWAAHAGVVAAQLARAGFTGPPTALEGRFGFYQAFCSGFFDEKELVDGLGESWCLPGIFYKPYPANHFTHAGIDAALRLRPLLEGRLDEIESIELGVAAPTLRTIAEPREAKIRPQSGYHAQFSGPFTVAAALLGGGGLGLWLDDFSDLNARDPRYLELAAKVTINADEECTQIFPRQFPAVLRVRMNDGREFSERVLANRGGPENPLSAAELEVKFRANAGRALSEEHAESLAVLLLDTKKRPVADLTAHLAAPSFARGES